jgi:hypothetical protein
MATLREYFIKDGSDNMTTHKPWELHDASGAKLGEVTARLHLDFEARAKYVSLFIPDMSGVELPEALVLNQLSDALDMSSTLEVTTGFADDKITSSELIFTGLIYVYSERPVPQVYKDRLIEEATKQGQRLRFRSKEYMDERNKWEKPRAFISHDNRDKKDIAEPIALELMKLMCPVWFDQYSLKVGDSLREGIETGLKDCPKCILDIDAALSQQQWLVEARVRLDLHPRTCREEARDLAGLARRNCGGHLQVLAGPRRSRWCAMVRRCRGSRAPAVPIDRCKRR